MSDTGSGALRVAYVLHALAKGKAGRPPAPAVHSSRPVDLAARLKYLDRAARSVEDK